MSNEQERAAFEAWDKATYSDAPDSYEIEADGSYRNYQVQMSWQAWQAASAGRAELLEALKALVAMLPSDHPERPEDERIPAAYCYVRWQEIREARAAIRKATEFKG